MRRRRPNPSDSLENPEINPVFWSKIEEGLGGFITLLGRAGTSAPGQSLHGAEGRQTQSLLPHAAKAESPPV